MEDDGAAIVVLGEPGKKAGFRLEACHVVLIFIGEQLVKSASDSFSQLRRAWQNAIFSICRSRNEGPETSGQPVALVAGEFGRTNFNNAFKGRCWRGSGGSWSAPHYPLLVSLPPPPGASPPGHPTTNPPQFYRPPTHPSPSPATPPLPP